MTLLHLQPSNRCDKFTDSVTPGHLWNTKYVVYKCVQFNIFRINAQFHVFTTVSCSTILLENVLVMQRIWMVAERRCVDRNLSTVSRLFIQGRSYTCHPGHISVAHHISRISPAGGAVDSVADCRALASGLNPEAAWICLCTHLIPLWSTWEDI